MSWVVDTCVIIDILRGYAEFSAPSADALDAKMEHGLLIAPITYVELAPSFCGNVAEQDELLADFGIGVEFCDNRDEILLAHRAWYEHVSRKRMGIEKRRPVADVLIGAYVMQKGSRERGSSSLAKLYKKMCKTAEFNPDGHPCIPEGLVFYGGELTWQRMAESVLAGRMKHVCVDFTYKKESVVSSKQMQAIELELNSAIPGYKFGIGGDFANDFENEQRQMQSLIWHYDVTFAEVMPNGDAKVGMKEGVKRLATKSTKKCVTAKSGSRSDGEAMILSRAKRYAKTEDAVKSGMLTNAQKADLEKLASKYGVGELRLEELIDEAFV